MAFLINMKIIIKKKFYVFFLYKYFIQEILYNEFNEYKNNKRLDSKFRKRFTNY